MAYVGSVLALQHLRTTQQSFMPAPGVYGQEQMPRTLQQRYVSRHAVMQGHTFVQGRRSF